MRPKSHLNLRQAHEAMAIVEAIDGQWSNATGNIEAAIRIAQDLGQTPKLAAHQRQLEAINAQRVPADAP